MGGLVATVLISILVLIGVSIASLMAIIGDDSLVDVCSPNKGPDYVDLENQAHFRFPPSASERRVSCHAIMDLTADIYFSIPPEDLNVFLRSTNIDPAALQPQHPTSSTPMPQDMRFEAASTTSYLYGLSLWPSFEQAVFIDTTDPGHYQVHFHTAEY